MKCPNCGTDNPVNAKFCEECGNKLPLISEEDTKKPGVTVKTPATPSSKGKGINTKILLLIIVVIILVGAVAAYLVLPSFFSSPQQATVRIVPAVSGSATVTANGATYPVTVDYYAISGGSGFIVSKQGHIVTAAHVVGDPYELRYHDSIKKMDDTDIKWYVAQGAIYIYLKEKSPSTLRNMTQADLDDLTNSAISSGAVKVSSSKLDIYVGGPAFPGSMSDQNYLAQIVDFEATDNQEKDLALLKVDSPPGNLATVSISSQKPKTGDSISIYGYPMEQMEFAEYIASTGNQKQFAESMANATLTKGIVSAERTSPKGTTYYQTDAAVNHGNSGGPVLNANNQVIGVLVLGFGNTGSFNFFLSSQYVTDMLKQNGINV